MQATNTNKEQTMNEKLKALLDLAKMTKQDLCDAVNDLTIADGVNMAEFDFATRKTIWTAYSARVLVDRTA